MFRWIKLLQIFKKTRVYRQLLTCSLSTPLLGITPHDSTYIDIALPFSYRTSSMAYGHITNVVVHLMCKWQSPCTMLSWWPSRCYHYPLESLGSIWWDLQLGGTPKLRFSTLLWNGKATYSIPPVQRTPGTTFALKKYIWLRVPSKSTSHHQKTAWKASKPLQTFVHKIDGSPYCQGHVWQMYVSRKCLHPDSLVFITTDGSFVDSLRHLG